MASDATGTAMGVLAGAIIAVAPRLADRITGRKKDQADAAEGVALGAGAVATAAIALLTTHREEAERAREAEDRCRRDLAALNRRCDQLQQEVTELRDALP